MFSIVIPLYNKEGSCERSINSVLKQIFTEWELIIIDDGSTDNSYLNAKTVSKNDSRIRIIQQENRGVSVARNNGIKQANYNYIVFLDADDYWTPDFLLTISSLINRYPYAGLYATAYTLCYSNGMKVSPKYKFVNDEPEGGILLDYCKSAFKGAFPIWTGAVCVKKEVLIKVGFFEPGVKRGEDLDVWLKIACFQEIVFINKEKSEYHLDTGNNLNLNFSSINESFPYWKWYDYDYKNKASLFSYTTYIISEVISRALKNKKYNEVIFCISKCRGKGVYLKLICFFIKKIYKKVLISK